MRRHNISKVKAKACIPTEKCNTINHILNVSCYFNYSMSVCIKKVHVQKPVFTLNVILRQIDTEKLFTWHFVGSRVNGLDLQSHSGERRSADSAHSVERTEEEEKKKRFGDSIPKWSQTLKPSCIQALFLLQALLKQEILKFCTVSKTEKYQKFPSAKTRGFAILAPKWWNELPIDIQHRLTAFRVIVTKLIYWFVFTNTISPFFSCHTERF